MRKLEMASAHVDLFGVYRLPTAMPLAWESSGLELEATIGGHPATVALPRAMWSGDRPVVSPPRLADQAAIEALLKRDHDVDGWGKASEWNIRSREVRCWWIWRIALCWHVRENEITYLSGPRGRRGTPTGEFVDGLFTGVENWFRLASAWIETLGPFDMGLHGNLPSVTVPGEGLSLVTSQDGEFSLPGESRTIQVLGGSSDGLAPTQLQVAVDRASSFLAPAEEQQLLADARAAVRRGGYRRAVIDAGTAVELVLGSRLEQALGALDERTREGLMAENRSLGRLVELAMKTDISRLPQDTNLNLVARRNHAVHRNRLPTNQQAQRAVEIAQEVVGPATDTDSEVDGSPRPD